jgi:ArsR family transcriptional regulator, arsenate/arsenite/antimonite-responsive transcriptional repressor
MSEPKCRLDHGVGHVDALSHARVAGCLLQHLSHVSPCCPFRQKTADASLDNGCLFDNSRYMELSIAVGALAALAQESRLQIYRLLVQAGPEGLAASKLAEGLGIPANTLSFHLKTLSHADLVLARPEGRFIYYSANYDRMNGLLGFLTENCCGGRSCVPKVVVSRRVSRKRRAL